VGELHPGGASQGDRGCSQQQRDGRIEAGEGVSGDAGHQGVVEEVCL